MKKYRKIYRVPAICAAFFLSVLLVAFLPEAVAAGTESPSVSLTDAKDMSGTVYLLDDADLLTDEEEQEIESLLADASQRCGVPVIGVTQDLGMDESALREYLADDILSGHFTEGTENGSSPDGIVYGIDILGRCDSVVSGGSVYETLGQRELDDIREKAEEKIYGAGREDHAAFADAFRAFSKRSEYYLNRSVSYRLTRHLAADLVIASVITVIVMVILFGMQRSRMETGAADYADRGSIHLRRSQDIYLRTSVVHRQAPKNTGSGSRGSGSFTGGGGGNFGSSSGRF